MTDTPRFYYPITLSGRLDWLEPRKPEERQEGDILLGEPGKREKMLKFSQIWDGREWQKLELSSLFGMLLFTDRENPRIDITIELWFLIGLLSEGKVLKPNRATGVYTFDIGPYAGPLASKISNEYGRKSKVAA